MDGQWESANCASGGSSMVIAISAVARGVRLLSVSNARIVGMLRLARRWLVRRRKSEKS
jgi:hypothetical protein